MDSLSDGEAVQSRWKDDHRNKSTNMHLLWKDCALSSQTKAGEKYSQLIVKIKSE